MDGRAVGGVKEVEEELVGGLGYVRSRGWERTNIHVDFSGEESAGGRVNEEDAVQEVEG